MKHKTKYGLERKIKLNMERTKERFWRQAFKKRNKYLQGHSIRKERKEEIKKKKKERKKKERKDRTGKQTIIIDKIVCFRALPFALSFTRDTVKV